ncbi:Ubiquitin carboxyl-terminal hydrolase 24 (Deubiquitinating enzyme 24) (AtUBP24) (Ubiquitin thioesterase 24) (Ubiquitin-specific-processing protease 24), partial [Durusdinium trenchii]
DGSLLIFEFKNFDGEEDAKELCQRFAAKGSCETAFCKGRLGKQRPRELCLLQGVARSAIPGGKVSQCTMWCACAPGRLPVERRNARDSTESGGIPLDFLAALDFFGMPHFAEIRVVRFGDGVPLEVRWEVGTNDEVIWEEEEEEENSETAQTSLLEGASEQAKSQDAPSDQSQIWIRVQRRRWADETDSNDDNDGETLASEARDGLEELSERCESSGSLEASPSIRPKLASEQHISSSSGSPKQPHPYLAFFQDVRSDRHRQVPSPDLPPSNMSDALCSDKADKELRKEQPRESEEDGAFLAECERLGEKSSEPRPEAMEAMEAIRLEGLRQRSSEVQVEVTGPAGPRGQASETCDRRRAEKAQELDAPSKSSKSEWKTARSKEFKEFKEPKDSLSMSHIVPPSMRRSLSEVTEELVQLLAEARASSHANPVQLEELGRAERRLMAALVEKDEKGIQEDGSRPEWSTFASCLVGSVSVSSVPPSVPRSRALSRASSYDSFFDGEGVRYVLASPENTQPSTPRSTAQATSTPTWPARYVLPEPYWLMDEPNANVLRLNDGVSQQGFDFNGHHGVFGEERGDLQMPITGWHDPVSPQALVLQRAPVRKRHGSKGSKASTDSESHSQLTQDEVPELRHVATSASTASMRKRQQASIPSGPSLGLMWHNSPFAISRTPNIHTPASHRSPARSPTSFSGYCSPIPGFAVHSAHSSGVASPQRRSGYSSPSTGGAFFGAAQSGLMRRLMSLREARGEEQEEDSDVSSRRSASDDGEPDLLELLLKHAERAPSRSVEPRLFSLDLRSDFPISSLRGLLPCHSVPFLNALVQTLLASSLKALLSQVSLTPVQRPAYSCFAQLCLEMEGSISKPSDLTSLNLQNIQNRPVDAGLLMEPLLRRFERGKSVQEAPAFPGPSRVPGLADMFSCFLHFFLGQLHDECKWPSVRSVSSSQQDSDDSPMMRIFGGLIQTSKERRPKNAKATDVAFESFLLLHLDLTPSSMALTSVSKALEELLAKYDACFRRLPPFLLLHLERFRTGSDGLPDRVLRKCRMDLQLELEEVDLVGRAEGERENKEN